MKTRETNEGAKRVVEESLKGLEKDCVTSPKSVCVRRLLLRRLHLCLFRSARVPAGRLKVARNSFQHLYFDGSL